MKSRFCLTGISPIILYCEHVLEVIVPGLYVCVCVSVVSVSTEHQNEDISS